MNRPVVNKVRCKKCNDIIESKHVHDRKECKCGTIYVDGGTEYQQYGWKSVDKKSSLEDEYIDFSLSVYE